MTEENFNNLLKRGLRYSMSFTVDILTDWISKYPNSYSSFKNVDIMALYSYDPVHASIASYLSGDMSYIISYIKKNKNVNLSFNTFNNELMKETLKENIFNVFPGKGVTKYTGSRYLIYNGNK